MIQSSRSLKPSNCDKTPEVDFSQLQLNTLKRYKKHYDVATKPGLNKSQMSSVIIFLLYYNIFVKYYLLSLIRLFESINNYKT